MLQCLLLPAVGCVGWRALRVASRVLRVASCVLRAPGDCRRGTKKRLSGGGGMLGTIHDYHRFCQMLLNGGAAPCRPKLQRFRLCCNALSPLHLVRLVPRRSVALHPTADAHAFTDGSAPRPHCAGTGPQRRVPFRRIRATRTSLAASGYARCGSTAGCTPRFMHANGRSGLPSAGELEGARIVSRKTVEWMFANHLCG
jgi:hypothetical protein